MTNLPEGAQQSQPRAEADTGRWAEPFLAESRLYYAPSSRLQQSNHLSYTQSFLQERGLLPEAFVPVDILAKLPFMPETRWNAQSDSAYNVVEEVGDFAFQLIKLSVGDEATTNDLISARRGSSVISQERILRARFEDTSASWVHEYLGDADIEPIISTIIASMNSRSDRGVSVVHTIPNIWRKLWSRDEARPGEYKELNEAVQAAEVSKSWMLLGRNAAVDVVEFGFSGYQRMSPLLSTENDFLLQLPQFAERFRQIFLGMNIAFPRMVELGVTKQYVRCRIVEQVRQAFPGEKGVDYRAIPKVITKLVVPYLVDQLYKNPGTHISTNF